ncbi:hypothetical protein K443DRAFT_97451, partial [Laccaria amethystina LaAM-08-1]
VSCLARLYTTTPKVRARLCQLPCAVYFMYNTCLAKGYGPQCQTTCANAARVLTTPKL